MSLELQSYLVGWAVIGLTIWVGHLGMTPAQLDDKQRGPWLFAMTGYVAAGTWVLLFNRIPWPLPWRPSRGIPELLIGGYQEFPVLYLLLLAFLSGMAFFCMRRFLGKATDH